MGVPIAMLFPILLILLIIVSAVLKSPKVKGFLGELSVRIILKKLKKEEFEVLHNIMLEKDGNTTQIDHVIIGRTGIFVVETKNYKGWIFGSEHSKFWTQTIFKSKYRFQNPIHQNYGHIKFLEHHLQDYFGPFFSIVAFSKRGTLKKIDIISEDIHVVHSQQLPRIINSKTVVGMSTDSVHRVAEMIRKANCMNKDIAKKHVQTIKQERKIRDAKLERNMCPKCNNELIEKSGKTGKFTSCSQYPKCRYTI
ncbi:NERD domain-containing protein [Paenisporosarcina antarctica]|uniref:NERD domain-containing protein n=1 Tax=Paenisporosarcina antarctica TaxID=417367 RepID=A0A4P7A2K3_9BACL|nr:NERD domain-containing protein [Paenisporosarcina antarctica]QBP43087.1 NERD domain-containing protein [Paenisporosarcina antarctica]